jgi:hypothetical protein
MARDDRVADIENMSLSELAALEADVVHQIDVRQIDVRQIDVRQVTAGTIAHVSDEVEARVRALRREVSSH